MEDEDEMPTIDLNLDGDNAWPDLRDRVVRHLPETRWQVATLPDGMQTGKPSIALRLDLSTGESLVTETSMAAWIAATAAMRARHPEAFAGTPLE